MARKVIITCAVTGAIHTPTMSPYLPVTAREIADAALGAAEAGAAIVHLHAREPHNGKPSQDPELFKPFLTEIKQKSDVVINITTGGAEVATKSNNHPVLTVFAWALVLIPISYGVWSTIQKTWVLFN